MQQGGLVTGTVPFLGELPHDHTVLTGLGECQLPKPSHTVHVVTMDVTSREGGKVDGHCRETPASHDDMMNHMISHMMT